MYTMQGTQTVFMGYIMGMPHIRRTKGMTYIKYIMMEEGETFDGIPFGDLRAGNGQARRLMGEGCGKVG
jgi:hypothetical protein